MKKSFLIISSLLYITNLQAGTQSTITKIPVVKTEKIKKKVAIRVPYMDCGLVEVSEKRTTQNKEVVGSVIGGIIGSKLGDGIGAFLGTLGGIHFGKKYISELLEYDYNGTRMEEECVKTYKTSEIYRVVGYKNFAKFNNIEIIKVTEEPLANIELKLNIDY